MWLRQWDPSSYLNQAQMPICWVNGTNDFAYPLDSWQKSYRQPKTDRTLCLRIRMPHGHGPVGENPEEIHVFANQFLKAGQPMVKITEQGHSADERNEGICSASAAAASSNSARSAAKSFRNSRLKTIKAQAGFVVLLVLRSFDVGDLSANTAKYLALIWVAIDHWPARIKF